MKAELSGRPSLSVMWTLIAVILMGTCAMRGQETKKSPPEFDGNWWLSASSEEQLGYLNGDADCSKVELGIKAKYSRSAEEDQRFVDQFYRDNPNLLTEPVSRVSRKVSDTPGIQRPAGGEVWTEGHGYFNGDWWTESSPLERLGFIEGYLQCYAEKRFKKAKFSKLPSFYVEQINRWYRVDDPPPIPPKIIDAKIADVLFRFRDAKKPIVKR